MDGRVSTGAKWRDAAIVIDNGDATLVFTCTAFGPLLQSILFSYIFVFQMPPTSWEYNHLMPVPHQGQVWY